MAATITLLKFNTIDGAQKALEVIHNLATQKLLTLQDGAVITWSPDKKRPEIRRLETMTGPDALDGIFWGMLFGLIF